MATTLTEDTGRGRTARITAPLLVAAGVLVLSIALHLRDPHRSGSWGFCPWLALTGTSCPGCGGLRAVNDLTRGDVAAALSSNLLVVLSLPVAAGLWARWLGQRWRGESRPLPKVTVRVAGWVTVGALLVFWVVRNLPGTGWLSP